MHPRAIVCQLEVRKGGQAVGMYWLSIGLVLGYIGRAAKDRPALQHASRLLYVAPCFAFGTVAGSYTVYYISYKLASWHLMKQIKQV
jgi:hypothetical protein